MHIGIDATVLYGRFGGVEYALWNLLGALQQKDHENRYTIYIPRDAPVPAFSSPRWNWARLPFCGHQKLRRIVWQQAELPARVLRDGCDVLHSPTYVCPLRAAVPIVLGVYDLIALTHPQFASRPNRLHYRSLLPHCLRRAREIVVPTAAVKRAVIAHSPGSASRVHVVPLAVESEFHAEVSSASKAQVRRKHHLPDEYLLFVGNYEPKKNIGSLLRALKFLPDAPPLVVAGGNNAWRGFQPASGARLQNLGYVPRSELPALYSQSRAFVFPTLAEGFGLPVLEALACGVPVVAGEAVPLPAIEEAALLCDATRPAALAREIAQILGNENLRTKLSRAGREYARPFTWQRSAAMTLDVYRAASQSS